MKKYIDDIKIYNIEKVNLKIDDWKNEIINETKLKTRSTKKWISLSLAVLSIILIIWHMIYMFNSNYNFIPFVLFLVSFFASIIFCFSYHSNKLQIFKSVIASKNINPYTCWLQDINGNINKEDNAHNWNESKYQDYSDLKYKLTGQKSINLKSEYDIFKSVIFNNPYILSCGIWQSETTVKGNKHTYDDYLPLIKVKTNLFTDEKIKITNSKKFYGFTKKDIILENDNFNKEFSVLSTNESAARMILTPLVQEKWLNINNLPPFNMEIKNGYINVLFWTPSDFMDVDKLCFKSLRKFSKINEKIWVDIKDFLSILTLIFSVSIFQFEEIDNSIEKLNEFE